MFGPSLSSPSEPLKILGILVCLAFDHKSGVQLIWDKMYPLRGSETSPLLLLSPPFPQVPPVRASGSIA